MIQQLLHGIQGLGMLVSLATAIMVAIAVIGRGK
jgi:hypothetical protein